MAAKPESQQQKNPLVLLIHSQQDFLDRYRDYLKAQGFRVEVAETGNQGINMVYQLMPDVIVTEIMLDDVNGYQICRLLKNDPATQSIPVVLISEYEEKVDQFWGVKAGADLFLRPDELKAKLVKQIRMLLEIYERVNEGDRTRLLLKSDRRTLNVAARLNQILDKALIESTLMIEFRNLSDLVHDTNLLNYMLFSLLESILEFDAAAIFFNDMNKLPREVTFYLPDGEEQSPKKLESLKEEFFKPLQKENPTAFDTLDYVVIGTESEEAVPVEYRSVHRKAFYVNEELIGSIAFYSCDDVDYDKIFPVVLIEDELQLLMKLRHLYTRAELLAVTDGLTGLFNYKYFRDTMEREFKSTIRYELDMTLALIDINNFTQYNEEGGYPCGDAVLKWVACCAEKQFRSVDVVARYSAGMLAVLFPKTSMEHAQIALERFQTDVESNPFQWKEQPLKVSVTIGVAAFKPDMGASSQMIHHAEACIAQAQKQQTSKSTASKNL